MKRDSELPLRMTPAELPVNVPVVMTAPPVPVIAIEAFDPVVSCAPLSMMTPSVKWVCCYP